MHIDSSSIVVPSFVFGWNDELDISINGGIYMFFGNGGADLSGGDPGNFMNIYLDYSIVSF